MPVRHTQRVSRVKFSLGGGLRPAMYTYWTLLFFSLRVVRELVSRICNFVDGMIRKG